MKPDRINIETQIDYVQLGTMLHDAREAKQISQEEVAITLRFRSNWVDALEKGKLDAFPSLVYARGYLLKYAQFLEVESYFLQPPVKEVVVESKTEKALSRSYQQVAEPVKVVKVISKVVQSVPMQASYAVPADAMIKAVSHRDDKQAQFISAQQHVRILYWAMIFTLMALLVWMFQEQTHKKSLSLNDVEDVSSAMVQKKL